MIISPFHCHRAQDANFYRNSSMNLLLTAHIVFDDAFVISNVNEYWNQVNRFVKRFVTTVGKAVSQVYKYETNVGIKPPVKVATPYGGRMMWTLPGRTKMFLHLKDRTKIRIKKRWSQVHNALR